MANGKKRSVLGIIEAVVIGLLILVIASILVLYFAFSDKEAAPTLGGFVFYHTRDVKMETEIPVNSAIIGKVSEIANIKAGSVIIGRIGEDVIISRVVQINNTNGELSYVTKFDTSTTDDTYEISSENIIAKAIWTSRSLGVLLDFATSTFGIMMIIIIPSFVIIVFQIIKIIHVKRLEEEAMSLDDLDDIMDDEDEDRFTVEGPDPDALPQAEERPVIQGAEEQPKGILADSPVFRPATFEAPEDENVPSFLNVDKNGRAELKKAPKEEEHLFTYEHADLPRRKMPVENIGGYYEEPETEEQTEEQEESANTSFMSNVLPEKLASAVNSAERPDSQEKPPSITGLIPDDYRPQEPPAPKPAAPTPASPVIPAKAVVPVEKLAPPPKRSTKKTINELMSLIDEEKSKLK